MSAHRPLCRKATQIVSETLRTRGAMTTQALLSAVHTDHPAALPARPLPHLYLAGAKRPPSAAPRRARTELGDDLPREPSDKDGTWSMAYLKRNVLARMQEQGEVVKMTKVKWEKLRGLESGSTSTAATPTTVETQTTPPPPPTGKTGKKAQGKKSQETHLWVLAEEVKQAIEQKKADALEPNSATVLNEVPRVEEQQRPARI